MHTPFCCRESTDSKEDMPVRPTPKAVYDLLGPRAGLDRRLDHVNNVETFKALHIFVVYYGDYYMIFSA